MKKLTARTGRSGSNKLPSCFLAVFSVRIYSEIKILNFCRVPMNKCATKPKSESWPGRKCWFGRRSLFCLNSISVSLGRYIINTFLVIIFARSIFVISESVKDEEAISAARSPPGRIKSAPKRVSREYCLVNEAQNKKAKATNYWHKIDKRNIHRTWAPTAKSNLS